MVSIVRVAGASDAVEAERVIRSLERVAFTASQVLRALAEQQHGQDVRLLERRRRAQLELRFVDGAGDVDLDTVLLRRVGGRDVERRRGRGLAAEHDAASRLELETLLPNGAAEFDHRATLATATPPVAANIVSIHALRFRHPGLGHDGRNR